MEVGKDLIRIKRELSDLDKFALDFIEVLENHSGYVLVSGYVSILLGRARASEDIDIIVPHMAEIRFGKLFEDLAKNGFECLNESDAKGAYSYIQNKVAVRFARKGGVIPNMELKFAKTYFDELALKTRIKADVNGKILFISQLELQVAFKEQVLKSDKDMEDARHIRDVAGEVLDLGLVNVYGSRLK